jgi:hypothetical protein
MANYFNSTFRIKPDSLGLQRSQKPMTRTKICLWAGKKTRANMKANAKLKREFEAKGITRCELGYPGCTKDDFLSWAHGKKRRKLQGDELTSCVILACINCHDVIERMSPEGMLVIVESVIAERGWTVREEKGSE